VLPFAGIVCSSSNSSLLLPAIYFARFSTGAFEYVVKADSFINLRTADPRTLSI
jgi:hypothetical protein